MRIYAQLLYLVLAAATVAGDKSRSSGKEKTIPTSEFLYRYVKKVTYNAGSRNLSFYFFDKSVEYAALFP